MLARDLVSVFHPRPIEHTMQGLPYILQIHTSLWPTANTQLYIIFMAHHIEPNPSLLLQEYAIH